MAVLLAAGRTPVVAQLDDLGGGRPCPPAPIPTGCCCSPADEIEAFCGAVWILPGDAERCTWIPEEECAGRDCGVTWMEFYVCRDAQGNSCWPDTDPCGTAVDCGRCWCDRLFGQSCPCDCADVQTRPCTVAVCQDGECVAVPKDCDDGDPCTVDRCERRCGTCVHTVIVCDDGNPCTNDGCDPAAGCVFDMSACWAQNSCDSACDQVGDDGDGGGVACCCGTSTVCIWDYNLEPWYSDPVIGICLQLHEESHLDDISCSGCTPDRPEYDDTSGPNVNAQECAAHQIELSCLYGAQQDCEDAGEDCTDIAIRIAIVECRVEVFCNPPPPPNDGPQWDASAACGCHHPLTPPCEG